MSIFRIAFSKASCQTYLGNDPNIKEVCKLIFERVSFLKDLRFSQLASWSKAHSEIESIKSKKVILTTYIYKKEDGNILVVVQALYPTLKFPNYLSFSFVGKVFADAFIINQAGEINSASDDDLWAFK